MKNLLKLFIFSLLISASSFGRAPAVEDLDKMNQEMLEREKAGKSYSSQYAALVDKKKVVKGNSMTLPIALGGFLLLIFPLAMWQVLMNARQVSKSFEKENLPESALRHFSSDTENELVEEEQKKAA